MRSHKRSFQSTDADQFYQKLHTPPTVIPEGSDQPAPLLFDDAHQPITDVEAWLKRRGDLRSRWHDFLGKIPGHEGVTNALEVIESEPLDEPAVLRQLVRYRSEPDLEVEGYLLTPRGAGDGARRPGAVVFHSTVDYTIRQPAGLEGHSDYHIGLQLAGKGFVVFCPRNFLWQHARKGESTQAVDWLRRRHPDVKGMAKMLFDAQRAVDVLSARPDVDATRICALGHSLGAKEVLYLAAFDERVRASVASEGGIGISYSNWDAPWYLGDAVKRPGFGLDHAQLLGLAAPRGFLLIGGDSADGARSWPYVEAVLGVWKLMGAPRGVGLFNHGAGHTYPKAARACAEAWIEGALA